MQLSMWAREGVLTDPRETHCSKGFFDQIGQAPVVLAMPMPRDERETRPEYWTSTKGFYASSLIAK